MPTLIGSLIKSSEISGSNRIRIMRAHDLLTGGGVRHGTTSIGKKKGGRRGSAIRGNKAVKFADSICVGGFHEIFTHKDGAIDTVNHVSRCARHRHVNES